MTTRNNFTQAQRDSALQVNAQYVRSHRVDVVAIADSFLELQRAGIIYYCENCLFCHTDAAYFDVDHVVPDRLFRE